MTQKTILTVGAVAFISVWLICLVLTVPLIERDLLERSHIALDAVSLNRNIVVFDGRHAILEGSVASTAEVERAESAVRAVRGVAAVANDLTITAPRIEPLAATKAPQPWVEIRFTEGGALVRGVVPGPTEKVLLVAAARELVPVGAPIHDLVEVDRELEGQGFYQRAPVVAKLLERTRNGALRMDSTTVRLEGTVPDEEARDTLLRLVRAAAPGLRIEDHLTSAGQRYRPPGDALDRPPEGVAAVDLASGVPGSLQVSLRSILADSPVDFAPGTAVPSVRAQRSLNRVAAALLEAPLARVEVAGHVAASGDGLADRNLSLQRARAVVDYLVGRGVGAARLSASGQGSRIPTAAGVPEDRIELHVVGED